MKLWTVTVEIEFPVLAETAQDAESYTDEAMRDIGRFQDYARARETEIYEGRGVLPNVCDEESDRVYGSHTEDITFEEAVSLQVKGAPVES